MSCPLPSPDSFPAFPYEKPYSIQLDLMRHVYSAIESRKKLCVVESPTGTGKTLSLLCASLTWLADEKNRAYTSHLDGLKESLRSDGEPDWVLEQTIEQMRRRLQDARAGLEERLAKAREREKALRDTEKRMKARKRKRELEEKDDDLADEDIFLPDDEQSDRYSRYTAASSGSVDDEDAPTITKIFYASRTHSQLSQVVVELAKLGAAPPYEGSNSPESKLSKTPTASLASRKHLCINDSLRAVAMDLDQACRDKLSAKHDRCPHLPQVEEQSRMLDFRDQVLAEPKDIEELQNMGRLSNICPYFGSRTAINHAELVLLPYNLLLQKSAREALEIDLTDQVVVIDEAHNLVDSILQLNSVSLSFSTVEQSITQLTAYLQRFRTKLSPHNKLHLKQLLEVLLALCGALKDLKVKGQNDPAEVKNLTLGITDFMAMLGTKFNSINLAEVQSYLLTSKITRKVGNLNAMITAKNGGSATSQNPLHAVESMISSLINFNADGQVVFDIDKEDVVIKYLHLNASTSFADVVQVARCVVLAGGTMSPTLYMTKQLCPSLNSEELSSFSCGHVIPSSNLLALVVGRGPSGTPLQFKYSQRNNAEMMNELGQTLINLIRLIPDGVVIFVPSYSFLQTVRKAWESNGLMRKLESRKKLFFEPSNASEVDALLKEYASAIDPGSHDTKFGSKRGAIIFAVVGAKLSEGINFADRLARAVIIIGLPFASLESAELKARIRYAQGNAPKQDNQKDPGTEFYENLCMRAVNQSIGRAVRHSKDWASLILVDSRFSAPNLRSKLPHWIRDSLIIPGDFGTIVGKLANFYRTR